LEYSMTAIRKLMPGEFSPLLSQIPDAPETLYVRGTLPSSDVRLLTVVGSRRMTPYGKDACEHLIAGLSGYPVAIVSGLALGIDAVAHRAALNAGLTTVAVPASGLDDSVLYPRSNLPLARDILARGGALLSEFEPDWKPRIESFPQRNRIMAAMSHATLIIEAGERSGTLITARLATDYDRELLVVPHGIFSEGGAGGHIFLKLGAAPVRSADDILAALSIEPDHAPLEPALNEAEQRVYDALAYPTPRDELIRSLDLHIGEANVLLASMELRGIIAESLGELRRVR